MKNLCCFILFCLFLKYSVCGSTENFDELWHKMQGVYEQLSSNKLNDADNYCHKYWQETREKIKNLLLGLPNPYFLYQPDLANAMVRTGFDPKIQGFELCHLKYCAKPITRFLLSRLDDTKIGFLNPISHDFNYSTNTLGHLYYLSRIFDHLSSLPEMIIEVGSGYGNLARLTKLALPQSTLILIDLPELIALQWLFLSASMPEAEIIVHKVLPIEFKHGAIHLLPTYYAEFLNIKVDLFISNFALSECPEKIQQMFINKRFFDAKLCYITGQLNGWTKELSFVNHERIISAVQTQYPHAVCNPFHIFNPPNSMSYEIIGAAYH